MFPSPTQASKGSESLKNNIFGFVFTICSVSSLKTKKKNKFKKMAYIYIFILVFLDGSVVEGKH